MLPSKVIAGDSFSYEITTGDYSADDGFSAVLVLRADTSITSNSTSVGTTHTFAELPAVTALWTEGHKNYVIYVTDGTDQFTVESGVAEVELRADLKAGAADVRTHAQKMLDAIESVLEGRATADVSSYAIGGRSITKMSIEELLELRRLYQREVRKETGAGSIRVVQGVLCT